MNPERLHPHGPRPADQPFEALRAIASGFGPWMLSADLGMPVDASLRQIAYLYASSTFKPGAVAIDTAVEVMLGGFAEYLALKGEPDVIDFR